MSVATMTIGSARTEADDGYPALEALIRERGAAVKGPLFTTDAGRMTVRVPRPAEEGGGTIKRTACFLYETFLANLPPERKQHYNCRACARFVDRFGGLVTVDDDGEITPVLWDGIERRTPMLFLPAVERLASAVCSAKVTGAFLSGDATWGTPFNVPGPGSKYVRQRWTHLSCPNPAPFAHKLLNADQMTAEKAQDFALLCRTLADTPLAVAAEAVRVLEADALSRADKALPMAKWFLDLRSVWEACKGREKTNRLWLAVAKAPPGFAHARNGMLGTLFADLMAGLGFEEVSQRWKAKMNPLQYQRPTALKAGNLEAAEKLIETLGAARSLERRYARLEEVKQWAEWLPTTVAEPAKAAGVFDHLKAEATGAKAELKPLTLPPKTLTWCRFRAEVLPTAARMELVVPHGAQPFVCLVTVAHADAPPILQWDGLPDMACSNCEGAGEIQGGGPPSPSWDKCPECECGKIKHIRNPVSWYFRVYGAQAAEWNLRPGASVEVMAVLPAPPHFQRPEQFDHFPRSVMFVLAGARDVAKTGGGGGLFPECLRAEYRDARAAIEVYAKAAEIGGKEEGDANGIAWHRGGERNWDCQLRVTDRNGAAADYRMDRWD